VSAAAKLAAVAKDNHPRRNTRQGNTRVPTPDEIRAAREKAGDTQAAAAARVLGSTKAWEQWESHSATENRRMHPGLFKLYLITTGQPVPEWLGS
jgi:hypothetical protein